MKFTVAIFALFATLSVAEMQQIPKVENRDSANIVPRARAKLNAPAMKNAQGQVVPFDSKNVYLDQMNKVTNGNGRGRK